MSPCLTMNPQPQKSQTMYHRTIRILLLLFILVPNFTTAKATLSKNPTELEEMLNPPSITIKTPNQYSQQQPPQDTCTLNIPKAYSPNSEINDYFITTTNCQLDTFSITIFNRWGVKIWHTNNPEEPWYGKHHKNNKDVPDGAYYYIVEYRFKGENQEVQKQDGTMTVMR